MYEIRRIDRAIEISPAGTGLTENTNRETNKPMIHETEIQAMRALNVHSETLRKSVAAGVREMGKEFAKGRSDRAAMPAALADALAKPFDREACAEQFSRECI